MSVVRYIRESPKTWRGGQSGLISNYAKPNWEKCHGEDGCSGNLGQLTVSNVDGNVGTVISPRMVGTVIN